MPFALVLIGLTMIIVAAKNTHREFAGQLLEDFTGPGNFVYWIAAIGGVGALGYIPALRTFSRYFMALILIAMLLSNRGFFAKLTEALQLGPISTEGGSVSGGGGEIAANAKAIREGAAAAQVDNTSADTGKNFGQFMEGVKFFMMGL